MGRKLRDGKYFLQVFTCKCSYSQLEAVWWLQSRPYQDYTHHYMQVFITLNKSLWHPCVFWFQELPYFRVPFEYIILLSFQFCSHHCNLVYVKCKSKTTRKIMTRWFMRVFGDYVCLYMCSIYALVMSSSVYVTACCLLYFKRLLQGEFSCGRGTINILHYISNCAVERST